MTSLCMCIYINLMCVLESHIVLWSEKGQEGERLFPWRPRLIGKSEQTCLSALGCHKVMPWAKSVYNWSTYWATASADSPFARCLPACHSNTPSPSPVHKPLYCHRQPLAWKETSRCVVSEINMKYILVWINTVAIGQANYEWFTVSSGWHGLYLLRLNR